MWKKLLFLTALAAFVAVLIQDHGTRLRVIKEFEELRVLVNAYGGLVEPWQLVFLSVGATLISLSVLSFVFKDEPMSKRFKRIIFKGLRRTPFIGPSIRRKLAEAKKDLARSIPFAHKPGEQVMSKLPKKGLSKEKIVSSIQALKKTAISSWEKGFVSGTVYNGCEELTDVVGDVYKLTAWSNQLHADIFPYARKLEAEAIQMCVDMFHGGPEACGVMTSGGTESIVMAMKAYREIAYKRGITVPEIVCPVSIHCAFDKAATYFGMKLVRVPVDKKTRKCDQKAMARAITSSTIVLAGSAPNFAHGIIDPIADIAKLATKRGLFMHVDCCLGGFILPFMEEAGYPLAPFDFRVKGVTSISCDTHKYGFAPKGSSIVMYANKDIRSHQYFIAPDWQGGVYATPSLAGSRTGAIASATWATMVHIGRSGYVEATRKVIRMAREVQAELHKIPGIYIIGKPEAMVIAVASEECDIYRVHAAMGRKGWNLNALQFPSSFHICFTVLHTQVGSLSL